MPARMLALPWHVCQICRDPATHEVHDADAVRVGYYCKACAKRQVDALNSAGAPRVSQGRVEEAAKRHGFAPVPVLVQQQGFDTETL